MAYENNGRFSGKYGDGKYGAGNGNSASPRKYKSNNVNTEGVLIVNDKMGKFLSISYWARCMSLSIGTFQSGMPLRYEDVRNAQLFRHTFTYTTVFEFKELCEEVLDNIKRNGKFESMSIDASAKNDAILEISNGTNINMPLGIYLVIYKGLDNTNRTNILEIYPFGNTKYVRNYDHNSGSFTNDISKVGEFKKFKKAVMNAANAFTMAQAHSIAEIKKTDKMATFKALAAITAAMGIDMTKELMEKKTTGQSSYSKGQSGGGKSYSGGGYRQYNGYQRQGQSGGYNAPRNPSPAVQNVQQQLMDMANEPVDLNIDLANLQNVALSDFNTDT